LETTGKHIGVDDDDESLPAADIRSILIVHDILFLSIVGG